MYEMRTTVLRFVYLDRLFGVTGCVANDEASTINTSFVFVERHDHYTWFVIRMYCTYPRFVCVIRAWWALDIFRNVGIFALV